jgi:adenosine deaminase
MANKDFYEKDYYKILGVSKNETQSEIKKHYRKLYDVLDYLKLYSILIQFSGNKSDKSFFANPGPNHKAG